MLVLEIDNRNIVGKWTNCVFRKIERKVKREIFSFREIQFSTEKFSKSKKNGNCKKKKKREKNKRYRFRLKKKKL